MDKLEVALKQIETGIDFINLQLERKIEEVSYGKTILKGQKDGLEFSRGIIQKLIEEGKPIKAHADLLNRRTITNYWKEKESSAPTQDSK